jgi:ABC-2 type transport system ATP-binding protein
MQPALEALGLTRYYGAVPAVRDLDLAIEHGAVLGLLGPNGSGKSTTVSMLTGLREPSAGRILWHGQPIADRLAEHKARVGYVPEEAQLYTFLSGREHLELVGRLRQIPSAARARKIASLLDLFGLTSAADQAISAYSKGMRQKIAIIGALLHDPELLILDEPESGLDLSASLVLRHLVPILASRGKAILYSSHVLDYVERLCGSVVVLHQGHVAAKGPVADLRSLLRTESSLEDMVAQLVATSDPRGTAAAIDAVVAKR